jgi:hypothetical protein
MNQDVHADGQGRTKNHDTDKPMESHWQAKGIGRGRTSGTGPASAAADSEVTNLN